VGSIFFAELPRQAPLPDFVVAADGGAPRPGAPAVLVVEDEPSDRAWLVRLLATAGYDVETAATGAEALARCTERRFDAITLDLLLPDLNGLDVLRAIRTGAGPNRETPVIVVTVVAESIASEFLVHDYLTKPLPGDALLASLERAGAVAGAGRQVLGVHLDAASAQLVQAALEQAGHSVVFAADAAEALLLAAGHTPVGLVLDPSMLGPDGFAMIDSLRRCQAGFEMAVIVWKDGGLTEDDRRRLAALAASAGVKARSGGTAALIEELRHCVQEPRHGQPREPHGRSA
jgi:CheY-like chemotaxis protein